MKFFKKILELIFNHVYPVLKPVKIQRFLRSLGLKFPYYRFAEKLDYRGVVDFEVNEKRLFLQSYNTPIEMFIFWFGIFGYWESTQLKLWSKLVLKADCILDIGANSGVYSVIATTNPDAKIFAFEPVHVVQDMLKKNMDLNEGHVKVEECLVGEKDGEETLFIPRSGWVDVASVNKSFASKFSTKDSLKEVVCPMVTVDTFLLRNNIPANSLVLCKIDVEGAEERVLLGMIQSLRTYKFLFTAELLDEETFKNFIKFIPVSYEIYAIDENKKSVYKTSTAQPLVTNYLFVPKNFNVDDILF